MFGGLASDEEPRLEDDEPTSVAPSNRFLTSEMPSLLWTILVKSLKSSFALPSLFHSFIQLRVWSTIGHYFLAALYE
jgi:hypothetical protein